MRALVELRRLYRLTSALFWVLVLATLIPAIYAIPRSGQWQSGFREAIMAFICRRCYACFNIHIRVIGAPCKSNHLAVPNHISWIDIVLLLGQKPYSFIAKSEVRDWPVFGSVSQATGTLFINRESKFSVYRDLPKGQKIIQRGQPLVVFPEGTTTMGDTLLHFFPMMYEVAVREKALVQPIAIRYIDEHGHPSNAAPFVGDESIIKSILRVAAANVVIAELHYLKPLQASSLNRKQLATLSRQAIYDVLLAENEPAYEPSEQLA